MINHAHSRRTFASVFSARRRIANLYGIVTTAQWRCYSLTKHGDVVKPTNCGKRRVHSELFCKIDINYVISYVLNSLLSNA